MALKAGYVGVKRWLYEKLQATTSKNVQDIADIWADNTKTGVHNFLLPLTGSYDNNGTTITPESDGVGIKINGTSTAEINYDYIPEGSILANLRGKFKLSLGVDSIAGMNVVFYKSTSGSWNLSGSVKEIEVNLTDAEHLNGKVRIYIANAKTYANVVINPMITALEDPDTTPAPYAMTNQQLTKSIVKTTGIFDQVTANKSGYMVELSFTGTTITNEDGKTLGTLDAAYRPSGNVNLYTKVYNGSSYVDAQVKVTASTGAVELLTLSGNAVTGAQVNFLLARPVFMSGSAAGLTRGVSDIREPLPEVIADDPEPVTKTTRKSIKKEDN